MTSVDTLSDKFREYYGPVAVSKPLVAREAPHSLPAYVGEWLVRRFFGTGDVDVSEARAEMLSFVSRHLAEPGRKEEIKEALRRRGRVTLIDAFSVAVDLRRNMLLGRVPSLDIMDAEVSDQIVEEHPRLLVNPVWGAGTLSYVPEEGHEDRMRVRLDRFESIQLSSFDLDLYAERRRHFTLDEWMRILISSQGLNPEAYPSEEQWLLLISRMAPMAQANLNLFELAPKGTGKTYIYKNLSTYSYVISGGAVTPAQLFYNLSTRPSPGLLAMNDVVVFDEIQTIHFGDSKEVGGILKDYMESGSFQRAKKPVRAYASCVFLGNIQMTESGDPANQRWFDELPFPLCESALIHRIHAFIPGWRLPKINIEEVALAKGDGFAADYLGEALHALRSAHHLDKVIQNRVRVIDTEDIRDERAIKRMTTALFKLLFPHGEATRDELMETCVRPAVEFRRHVRRQLQLKDPEFRDYPIDAEVDGPVRG